MSNAAADAWGMAQSEGREIAAGLSAGEHWYKWDDYAAGEEPGEMVHAEVRRALRDRGLTLVSGADGMMVEEIESEES